MKNPHFVRIQKILGPLVRFLFPISLEGTENLPEDRPVMLCANHSSAWDPVLFVAAIWWTVGRCTSSGKIFEKKCQ